MNSCPKIHIEILFFGHVTDTPEKNFPAGQSPPRGGTPPIGGGAPARASRASRAPKLPWRVHRTTAPSRSLQYDDIQ